MVVFIVRKLTFVLLFFGALNVYAQESSLFFIRNYQYSNVILLEKNKNSQLITDAYGNRQFHTKNSDFSSNYTFQGQEYDGTLNLYFFASRFYEENSFRFMQPDPKSQYNSPYSFVNADPVNFVDLDGKEGKPIVFYGKDHTKPMSLRSGTHDLYNEVPSKDAYYISLPDFMNGEVGDLPEWNGNVFIEAHMGTDSSIELEIERASYVDDFETFSSDVGYYESVEPEGLFVGADAENFGRSLRRFPKKGESPLEMLLPGDVRGLLLPKG